MTANEFINALTSMDTLENIAADLMLVTTRYSDLYLIVRANEEENSRHIANCKAAEVFEDVHQLREIAELLLKVGK